MCDELDARRSPSAEHEAIENLTDASARAVLDGLPPDQRNVMVLRTTVTSHDQVDGGASQPEATGVAGATGVLPTAAQEVFNEVTGQVPAEVVTDSGVDTKVDVKTSQEVKLDAEVRAELDEEAALKAAEDAVQSGLGTVEEQRQAALDAAEELGQTGVEKAEELGQTGLETVEGVGGAVGLEGDAGVDVGAGVQGH